MGKREGWKQVWAIFHIRLTSQTTPTHSWDNGLVLSREKKSNEWEVEFSRSC